MRYRVLHITVIRICIRHDCITAYSTLVSPLACLDTHVLIDVTRKPDGYIIECRKLNPALERLQTRNLP